VGRRFVTTPHSRFPRKRDLARADHEGALATGAAPLGEEDQVARLTQKFQLELARALRERRDPEHAVRNLPAVDPGMPVDQLDSIPASPAPAATTSAYKRNGPNDSSRTVGHVYGHARTIPIWGHANPGGSRQGCAWRRQRGRPGDDARRAAAAQWLAKLPQLVEKPQSGCVEAQFCTASLSPRPPRRSVGAPTRRSVALWALTGWSGAYGIAPKRGTTPRAK
jgi:hypothetical protein